ncbi:MAG: hypothetical protein L0215_05805 [Gemmataceae bacterium]|nr:hypothetical protein [Gemmataceae bacterium]
MDLFFAYRRRSAVIADPHGLAVSLAPNLRRDRVSFSGVLRDPVRFREAMSALHDVVISDLRYKPRDKSAYELYKAQQAERERAIRQAASSHVRRELLDKEPEPIPPGLEKRFHLLRNRYWKARDRYSDYLMRHDPEMWRLLMPCDPVITVAQDVLFFECFSADESSYGCLSVQRDAFAQESDVALGTTNVDYSWDLYEHFQKLRTYRETRFQIDPAGFGVAVAGEGYREEKIDLPQSWLRGFMQLQAVQTLPMRRVPISLEALYSLLAFLKRHRARRSPRAVRFELEPGNPIQLVLEPWEQRIVMPDVPYQGKRAENIRVWGRDRLRVLGRLLPLIERADVYLVGTGLPSFWVMHLGDMRLTLGLSGWTANDWTAANALDQIAPPAEPSDEVLGDIAAVFREKPAMTFAQIQQRTGAAPAYVAAGLNRLALLGQLIHDLPAGLYRWRQVLPVALALNQLGEENPETVAAREITARRRARLTKDEKLPNGLRVLEGKVDGKDNAVLLDADGRMLRGQCNCSHHFKNRLRRGPCRHLQALRNAALGGQRQSTLEQWFDFLWN